MMQETLLRVFVVALGLLVCPRDDPGVEDWDEVVAAATRKHEETLQREEEEELQRRAAPVRGETDGDERRDDAGKTRQGRGDPGGDGPSGTTVVGREDGAETKGRFAAGSSDNKTQAGRKTSNAERKAEDARSDGSVRKSDGRRETSAGSRMFVFSPLSEAATEAEEEVDFLWYVCNVFSLVSAIRFFWGFLGRSRRHPEEDAAPSAASPRAVAEIRLPDADTLRRFHARRVQVSSGRKWEADFLEGFVNELLDAMRGVSEQDGGALMIQDLETVNRHEFLVAVGLPEPFGFRCRFSSQLCGQIEVVETRGVQNGCACQSSDGEDVVCLLHGEGERAETERAEARDGPFCMEGTALLSRSRVGRWFRGAVRRAWALISHKFQFQLSVRYLDAPGAFAVRFRSGRTLGFSVSPAVKHDGAHFLVTPPPSDDSDASWTVSLTGYEDRLLERLASRLPGASCHLQVLDVALFLHRRQKALSGDVGALRDLHFRAALTHLLRTADPSLWGPDAAAAKLRDLLAFVEAGLRKRLLRHVLVGDPSAGVAALPAGLSRAQPVNLFHPLVVHECMYRNAVAHFQEMLRNAHAMIHEYAASEPGLQQAQS